MNAPLPSKRERSGYSLIEVVIASAVLMMVIAAAVAMALTVATQTEANARITIALDYQEQAARLYQLGIAADSIVGILPNDPTVSGLVFNNGMNGTIDGIDNMERMDCVMEYKPSPATADPAAGNWVPGDKNKIRVNTVVVIRPSIR